MRQLEYKGYIEYTFPTEQDMADFYENVTDNVLRLKTNQYALLYSPDSNLVDRVKWNGEKYVAVTFRNINNDFVGKVKPRNIQQELAFDMLQNDDITIKVLVGGFGTGKDFVMISNAIQLLKNNKFERLVWVRNNVEVKNTNPLGALPDGVYQKLLPFALPLADHLGGVAGLEMFVNQGRIEIQHLGFMRGRDIKDSIIYCSEAENMTKEHIQLLIGRVGDGSALWLNGDFKQTDMKVFDDNNGLYRLIEKLQGNRLFGVVQLIKTERSETAALADLLD